MTYGIVTEKGLLSCIQAEAPQYAYDTERYMEAITSAPEVLHKQH